MSVGADQSEAAPIPSERGLRFYPALKRGIDIALSLIALVVLSPLLALIAVLIKLYSPGPALFVHERVGYDRRTKQPRLFKLYKFRSMHCNADPARHREHMVEVIRGKTIPKSPCDSLKMKADPRITGVGRILRRSSLDELPQLINVLKGDMSMVGPRPALPYEVDCYEDWHRQRLLAVPGITGYWQVKARNRVSFDEMVCMDLFYIQNMSLSLDLKILLLTPVAVVMGDGAG